VDDMLVRMLVLNAVSYVLAWVKLMEMLCEISTFLELMYYSECRFSSILSHIKCS
jgi:hypothetical protein